MIFGKPSVIEKPWGREILFADEPEYAGKILEVYAGRRLSLQYHERKKESMYVIEGRLKMIHDDGETVLDVGDTLTIYPGDKHRVEALSDVRIIEVSTSHLDDVVRLEDDYERSTE